MLDILKIEVTPFAQNCRVLYSRGDSCAVVIDPGGEADLIFDQLNRNKLSCSAIWLTHAHLDHCGGVRRLKELTQAPLYASTNPGEVELRKNVVRIAQMYGLFDTDLENSPEPDTPINGGETVSIGSNNFRVIFTPGHSPGHLCFYCEQEQLIIAGDTLFAGSIGRTDIPGGSHDTLISSIESGIMTLPDVTRVLSGHGPDTTVGAERKTNPFLR